MFILFANLDELLCSINLTIWIGTVQVYIFKIQILSTDIFH